MQSVILRSTKDAGGTRYLSAKLSESGDVVIEGQDLGDSVERIFGVREYEWVWTIKATHVPGLGQLLGGSAAVIDALAARFSGDKSSELRSFLEDNAVPFEVWSRTGD